MNSNVLTRTLLLHPVHVLSAPELYSEGVVLVSKYDNEIKAR